MKISRKEIIVFVIVLTIILAGILTYQKFDQFLKTDTCLDKGGSWNYELQECELSSGREHFGTLLYQGIEGKVVYKIYSQREQFEKYLSEIKKDSSNNYLLWENCIYNATKDYWQIEFRENTEKSYEAQKKSLYEFQAQILEQEDILSTVKKYEAIIEHIALKTFSVYNKKADTVHIILVPMGWQGGTVKPYREGQSVMPIGVNLLHRFGDTPERRLFFLKNLIPHEYTHKYNDGISLDNELWEKSAKMFWSLWTEGLATYGTGYITGDFDVSNVMLYKEYEEFDPTPELNAWLSRKFLEQYYDKLLNNGNDERRAMWFSTNSSKLKKGLPPAIGYYLGFIVVKFAIENYDYTFEYLLSLPPKKLEEIGFKILNEISKTTANKAYSAYGVAIDF